ncbi:MAG: hypothetical protein Q8Q23_01230 [bacterium]|nr:hypothetical protein [bacterium]
MATQFKVTNGPNIDEDVNLNPHPHPDWKCDRCDKSFLDSVQPCQTFDGGTVCAECFKKDDDGPQIARYGIAQHEAENEPERVVDEDGKVDYE